MSVAQNITTRVALKNLLTANYPGGTLCVSGVLNVMVCKTVKCWKCGVLAILLGIAPSSQV